MDERHQFGGRLGFILASAGAAVGLGNIWRFPYLAAKYGGGIFLLVYVIFCVTFGYTMVVAETAIGRITRQTPATAFAALTQNRLLRIGGWLNAIVPLLIAPYYSVIGGWVLKYFVAYLTGQGAALADDTAFSAFISSPVEAEIYFILFAACTLGVIYLGVRGGIERVAKMAMPLLVVLALLISGYICTRPGAGAGIRYYLVPDITKFSYKTLLAALTQMFFSLSIAMGILITFGAYMKREVGIEDATFQIEIFDTGIAVLAGFMIIPAVFAYSGGDANALSSGPSLMFVTIPKVFASMAGGGFVGGLFFALVFFAALTSAIALAECSVSALEERLHWSRSRSTIASFVFLVALGSLSCLGFGPLANVRIFGMQFLDFFDFITNSVMMPAAALAICLLITKVIGLERVAEELEFGGQRFKLRPVFNFMIRWVCPICVIAVLIFSIASIMGLISL